MPLIQYGRYVYKIMHMSFKIKRNVFNQIDIKLTNWCMFKHLIP